jgi:predicted PurR-regulated permease PerM
MAASFQPKLAHLRPKTNPIQASSFHQLASNGEHSSLRSFPLPSDSSSPELVLAAPSPSRVRGHIIFFFCVLLALALAWKLRTVLELVYVSALFAVVLMPIVQRMMLLRIPFRGRTWSPSRPIAIIGLLVTALILLGGFFFIGLPPVVRDVQHFAADLPARIPQLVAKIKRLPIADKLGVDQIGQKAEGIAAFTAQYLFNSAPLWLSHLLDIITAFILCIYFMLEGEFAYQYFLSLFPLGSRDRLARTLVVAEHRMSKWLIGQASLMLILGVCSLIAFGFLHVRYFVLLGVLMGLLNIIPIAGGVITILLAGGVAALDSWQKMLGVFLFYAIYIQVENGYLTPKIMKSSVDLMGLTVLVALLAGSEVAGVVGALVAVPTAALIAVLMDEYLVQKDPQAEQVVDEKLKAS